MSDLPDLDVGFERKLVREVADRLEDRGWSVEVESPLGPSRPDIVAKRADGVGVLMEFKVATNRPVHFASVAQTASYARLAEAYSFIDDVTPVLIALGEATPSVTDAADNLGVHLIAGPERAEGEFASRVVEELDGLALSPMMTIPPKQVPDDALETVREWAGDSSLEVLHAERRAKEGAPRWHLQVSGGSWWRVTHTVHGWNASPIKGGGAAG